MSVAHEPALTARQLQVLQHATDWLRLPRAKRLSCREPGDLGRCWFAAEIGSEDHRVLRALADAGLVYASHFVNSGAGMIFYVTSAGIAALRQFDPEVCAAEACS